MSAVGSTLQHGSVVKMSLVVFQVPRAGLEFILMCKFLLNSLQVIKQENSSKHFT